MSRRWRQRLDQRLRPLGLSEATWRVLVHLARHDNPPTQGQLARSLGIEGASLVGLLDRLEEEGLLRREVAAGDRRAKVVHLCPAARPLLKKIRALARGLREELLRDIPADDLQVTQRALLTLRAALERDPHDATQADDPPAGKP